MRPDLDCQTSTKKVEVKPDLFAFKLRKSIDLQFNMIISDF